MINERFYTVETPEQIDVAFDVAGIGSRFLAALIDHLLILLLLGLSCTLAGVIANQLALGWDETIVYGLFGLGVYLGLCAYYIFFETIWNGQTPGKRLIGLRMVQPNGRPISFLGSAIRNIIRLADFLPLLYGLGIVVMFIDKRSRRLGDLAAGCMAVREGATVSLASLATPTPTSQAVVRPAPTITIPNLAVLRQDDYEIVQEYLRRRGSLSYDARMRLSQQIVGGLQQRLGYPVQGDAETFLMMVASEYQTLHATT